MVQEESEADLQINCIHIYEQIGLGDFKDKQKNPDKSKNTDPGSVLHILKEE